MPLPKVSDIVSMDWSYRGQPFVSVPSKSGNDTTTLDWSYRGQPFGTDPWGTASYSQICTDGVTTTATTALTPAKILAGVLTSTSSLLKTPTKVLAARATATGATITKAGKVLSDGITGITGGITGITKGITDGITASGTYAKLRAISRTVADSIATATALGNFAIGKVINATLGAADAILDFRSIHRVFSDAITPNDLATRSVGRILATAVGLLDSKRTNTALARLETTTTSENTRSGVGKRATDTMTATGTPTKGVAKGILASFSLHEAYITAKGFIRTFSETITASDTYAKIHGFIRVCTDAITATNDWTRDIAKRITQPTTIHAIPTKRTTKSFIDSFSVSDLVYAAKVLISNIYAYLTSWDATVDLRDDTADIKLINPDISANL